MIFFIAPAKPTAYPVFESEKKTERKLLDTGQLINVHDVMGTPGCGNAGIANNAGMQECRNADNAGNILQEGNEKGCFFM